MTFTDYLTTPEEVEPYIPPLPDPMPLDEAVNTPEELLRAAHFKIKLVAPTKFGTQISFAKKYDDDDIKEILKGFTLKFDGKDIFIIA